MLYAYCAERGIDHRRCGKLIVATSAAQVDELHAIRQRAAANGVDDLRLLTREEAQALEPALACRAALLSPSMASRREHNLCTNRSVNCNSATFITSSNTVCLTA